MALCLTEWLHSGSAPQCAGDENGCPLRNSRNVSLGSASHSVLAAWERWRVEQAARWNDADLRVRTVHSQGQQQQLIIQLHCLFLFLESVNFEFRFTESHNSIFLPRILREIFFFFEVFGSIFETRNQEIPGRIPDFSVQFSQV